MDNLAVMGTDTDNETDTDNLVIFYRLGPTDNYRLSVKNYTDKPIIFFFFFVSTRGYTSLISVHEFSRFICVAYI